jgi:hypothetical protein
MMRTLGIIVWVTGMAYTALCLGIPEIRIYWKGTDKKMGTVSCVGFALFFWWPVLVWLLGWLIPKEYLIAAYGFVMLAFIIAMIGYGLDISN